MIGPIALSMVCAFPAIADRKSLEQEPPSHPAMLVKFEASAVEAQDQPVTDLQSSECRVAEDGKRETIALFGYDGNRQQATALTGPHEYSNRGAFATRPTVILLTS